MRWGFKSPSGRESIERVEGRGLPRSDGALAAVVTHDIHIWDALAWTPYKKSQPQEAAGAIKEALHLDAKDPLLLFHASMIYERLSEKAKG